MGSNLILQTNIILSLQRNTFQCVVATNNSETFAFFLYADINWVHADEQEHLAQIGFDSGDRTRFYRLPNTTTEMGIKNLVNTSNTGTRGMWAFKISYSENEIKPAKCTKHTGMCNVDWLMCCVAHT